MAVGVAVRVAVGGRLVGVRVGAPGVGVSVGGSGVGVSVGAWVAVGYGGGAVMAFLAPLAVAAMIEPAVGTNQPWLDAAWAAVVQQPPTDYYSDSLKLMAMLVVSGNWWTP